VSFFSSRFVTAKLESCSS